MGLYVQAQVVAASAPRIVAPAPQGATLLVSGAGNSSAGLATANIHIGSSGVSLQQPPGQMPASFEPTVVSGMAADKSGSVGVLGASLQALSLTPGPANGSIAHGANGVLGGASSGPRGYQMEMQRQQAPPNYSSGMMTGGNGGPQRGGGGGGFGPGGHLQHPAYEYPSGPPYVNPQGVPPPGGAAGLPGGPGAIPAALKIGSKVFVGGLSWETSDQKLRQYFENYGEVLEAFVSYDKNTGRPRGFGFVVFAEAHIADKVVSLQHTIDRREVEAKKAVPRQDMTRAQASNMAADHSKIKKIFVGGLAPTVDEKSFREYFENFGPVEDAVVMYDPHSSRPRGFGFVTFESLEAVELVFTRGVMQELHEKQIEIKRAVPREEMAPPRRSRPVHHPNGAVYPPPHPRGPMGAYGQPGMPKHGGYGQPGLPLPPPPPQQQGQPIWGPQNGYDYMGGQSAPNQHRYISDQDNNNMYSGLTAGLAAASSMGLSNEFGNFLNSSGNTLPASIDIAAHGGDPSNMNLSIDAAINSLSGNGGGNGAMNNHAGGYSDPGRRAESSSADNASPPLSNSFSVPGGYGLAFSGGNYQGSI